MERNGKSYRGRMDAQICRRTCLPVHVGTDDAWEIRWEICKRSQHGMALGPYPFQIHISGNLSRRLSDFHQYFFRKVDCERCGDSFWIECHTDKETKRIFHNSNCRRKKWRFRSGYCHDIAGGFFGYITGFTRRLSSVFTGSEEYGRGCNGFIVETSSLPRRLLLV